MHNINLTTFGRKKIKYQVKAEKELTDSKCNGEEVILSLLEKKLVLAWYFPFIAFFMFILGFIGQTLDMDTFEDLFLATRHKITIRLKGVSNQINLRLNVDTNEITSNCKFVEVISQTDYYDSKLVKRVKICKIMTICFIVAILLLIFGLIILSAIKS